MRANLSIDLNHGFFLVEIKTSPSECSGKIFDSHPPAVMASALVLHLCYLAEHLDASVGRCELLEQLGILVEPRYWIGKKFA